MAKLTPAQMEVVNHDGNLLVVAGPGSGKTTTSVAKARRILQDPNRTLMMVTFSKTGADEMRDRLKRNLAAAGVSFPGEERLLVATFHSIALRHLKKHGLRKRLLDTRAGEQLLAETHEACNVEFRERQNVGHEFEKIMYSPDPEAVRDQVSSMGWKVYETYCRLRDKTGQVDLYTVMRDCALGVASGTLPLLPFTDMLVDEGQDSDELQRQWIFSHARGGCRVTIVADDDQSIYEWRNALGYSGLKAFLDEFNARSIELGENFRCRSEVLTPAVTLITKNRKRLGKHLLAKRGAGGALIAFNAGPDQNRDLARVIRDLPQKHVDCAILARFNRDLDAVEMALRKQDIAYTRVGASIWDNPSVVGYLALLQTLLDATPTGLISVLKLKELDPQLRHEVLDVGRGHAIALLDGAVPDLAHITAADKLRLAELARDLAYWRRQLRAGSIREVIIDVSRYISGLQLSEHKKNLVNLCGDILCNFGGPLSSRLQAIGQRTRDNSAAVQLMTMHGSKGMEFETVHIVDMNKADDASVLHVEAERRLTYVAITRAKNACVVWFSKVEHPCIGEADVPPKVRYEDLLSALQAAG